MAGRASIVGAAATHVGKVREHNEDAYFFDADAGVFLVCDGMGGHAAGEVASALAIRTIRSQWASQDTAQLTDAWLANGSPDSKKQMLGVIRDGVLAAHDAIIEEAARDEAKSGMGTTLVGAMIVGNELVFAQAGDSRAYLVRDAIAMQLTEDHTLLARLLAAGIDVDVSGEGSRFRSMLTNALGIGNECKVATFVVPLADGDRFLFCSDGISEYVKEAEVGEVLSKQPSPARAAQKLIELALDRGGGDNATAIVVRVLEAGETPQPAEHIRRDDDVIATCPLWGARLSPQQRLRALRIAIPRDHAVGERLPAQTLGDRVAWILVEGKLVQDGGVVEAGALIYPESLLTDSPLPDRDGLAVAKTDCRVLALRSDDFREICDDDSELGEALLEALAALVAKRRPMDRQQRADTEIDTLTLPVLVEETVEPVVVEPPSDRAKPAATPQANHFGGKPAEPRASSEPTPVGSELDARFDAMFAPSPQESEAPPKPPPTKRVPLILKPHVATDLASVRLPPVAIAMPPRRKTDSAVVSVSIPAPKHIPRLETEPGSVTRPSPPIRAVTEPEIETYIELEAEPPPISTSQSDLEPELMIVRVDEDETETVIETSEQTLTVTVTADPDEERTRIRRPLTSDEQVSVSGTISTESKAPRAKRLSEGWDD